MIKSAATAAMDGMTARTVEKLTLRRYTPLTSRCARSRGRACLIVRICSSTGCVGNFTMSGSEYGPSWRGERAGANSTQISLTASAIILVAVDTYQSTQVESSIKMRRNKSSTCTPLLHMFFNFITLRNDHCTGLKWSDRNEMTSIE